MPEHFSYDVFLSHGSKDKAVVREIANRLKDDKVRVWFDEWVIRPGDNVPYKINQGLEQSRVLVLCMSANAFASDWTELESQAYRFRDPLNKGRRFIPLRLDNAPIKPSLAQFLYVDWTSADRGSEYQKLLTACRQPLEVMSPATDPQVQAPASTNIGDENVAIAVSQVATASFNLEEFIQLKNYAVSGLYLGRADAIQWAEERLQRSPPFDLERFIELKSYAVNGLYMSTADAVKWAEERLEDSPPFDLKRFIELKSYAVSGLDMSTADAVKWAMTRLK